MLIYIQNSKPSYRITNPHRPTNEPPYPAASITARETKPRLCVSIEGLARNGPFSHKQPSHLSLDTVYLYVLAGSPLALSRYHDDVSLADVSLCAKERVRGCARACEKLRMLVRVPLSRSLACGLS